MPTSFSDFFDKVLLLETEQMEELQVVLSKILIDRKRDGFLRRHKDKALGNLFGANKDEVDGLKFKKKIRREWLKKK